MTSSFSCCLRKDRRLLKIFEEGSKMVNKEFDVLQLYKTKKHNKIVKKHINIDLESGESNLSHYSNSTDEEKYEEMKQRNLKFAPSNKTVLEDSTDQIFA